MYRRPNGEEFSTDAPAAQMSVIGLHYHASAVLTKSHCMALQNY
jgi:hypothetical protein